MFSKSFQCEELWLYALVLWSSFYILKNQSLYYTTNHDQLHWAFILCGIYSVFYLPHGQNRCINNRHSCEQSCAVQTEFGHCALVPVVWRAFGNGNVKHCLVHQGSKPRSIVLFSTGFYSDLWKITQESLCYVQSSKIQMALC